MLAAPFLTKNCCSLLNFRKTLFLLSLHFILKIFLSVIGMISNLMNGRYSFPMWLFIRFVRWSPSLSSLWNPSASSPRMCPPSFTPTSKFPPLVFRPLCSIRLSNSFVWRFVLKLDLNSIVSDSPLLIISIAFLLCDIFLFGPKSPMFLFDSLVMNVLIRISLSFFM